VNEFIISKGAAHAALFFAQFLHKTPQAHAPLFFHSSSTSISMRIFSMDGVFSECATDARR
jgi:hypothetical protein